MWLVPVSSENFRTGLVFSVEPMPSIVQPAIKLKLFILEL